MHGQPTNRLAGLTTAIDAGRGIAPDIDADGNHEREVLDADRASEVVKELVDRAGLATARTRTDLELDVRIDARVTEGVRFDGKERMRFAVKTDVRAHVTVNGLTVSGPRAGLSATFTDGDRPIRLFAASWDTLEGFDERPLLDRDEVIADLLSTRPERYAKRAPVKVLEATLGYWAGEYTGGADLLEPSWFVEIEHGVAGKARRPAPPAPPPAGDARLTAPIAFDGAQEWSAPHERPTRSTVGRTTSSRPPPPLANSSTALRPTSTTG